MQPTHKKTEVLKKGSHTAFASSYNSLSLAKMFDEWRDKHHKYRITVIFSRNFTTSAHQIKEKILIIEHITTNDLMNRSISCIRPLYSCTVKQFLSKRSCMKFIAIVFIIALTATHLQALYPQGTKQKKTHGATVHTNTFSHAKICRSKKYRPNHQLLLKKLNSDDIEKVLVKLLRTHALQEIVNLIHAEATRSLHADIIFDGLSETCETVAQTKKEKKRRFYKVLGLIFRVVAQLMKKESRTS